MVGEGTGGAKDEKGSHCGLETKKKHGTVTAGENAKCGAKGSQKGGGGWGVRGENGTAYLGFASTGVFISRRGGRERDGNPERY